MYDDLSLLPSRSNRKAAKEFIKHIKRIRKSESETKDHKFVRMGFTWEKLLSEVFSILSEEEMLEDLRLYVEFFGKKKIGVFLSQCLAAGREIVAIEIMKIYKEIFSKFDDNPYSVRFYSFYQLRYYYENFGLEKFCNLVEKCHSEGIKFTDPSAILLYPSNVLNDAKQDSELLKLLKKSGISFYKKINGEFIALDDLEIEKSNLEEIINRPATFDVIRKFYRQIESGAPASQVAEILVDYPSLLSDRAIIIFQYWSETEINIDKYSIFLEKIISEYTTEKSSGIVALAMLFCISEYPAEAKLFFESYLDKFEKEIIQKQQVRNVNSKRYDAFNSIGWCIKIIDQISSDTDKLIDLFKVLRIGAVPTKFMESTVLYYLANNYIEKIDSTFLRKFQTYVRPINSIDIHEILKNIALYSNMNQFEGIYTDFHTIFSDENWSVVAEIGWKNGDQNIVDIAISKISDPTRKKRITDRSQFLIKLKNEGIDSVLLFFRQKSYKEESYKYQLNELLKSSKTSDYSKIFTLMLETLSINDEGVTWLYRNFFIRFFRKQNWIELLSFIDSSNLNLQSHTVDIYLMKLVCLQKLNRRQEFSQLLKDLASFGLGNDLSSNVDDLKNFIFSSKINGVLDSLLFELPEVGEGRTKTITLVRDGIQRDRSLVIQLKEMYNNTCQVCGFRISTPFGAISEAAHIQGIGSPHYGPDVLGNLLVLCPNHHTSFDNAGWYLDDNFNVVETNSGMQISKLNVVPEHKIVKSAITYQRNYALKASILGKRKWKSLKLIEAVS
jgi:HNH endonuclease